MEPTPPLERLVRQAERDGGLPVLLLLRRGKPLWAVLPPMDDPFRFLARGHRASASGASVHPFLKGSAKPFVHWEMPRAWLDVTTRRMLTYFGGVYVVQAVRNQNKCAPACWNAKGVECECACLGANHGAGHPDGRWYVVSETLAFSRGDQELHYKLIRPRGP